MPRLAALIIDVAVAYAVVILPASVWLPDDVAFALTLAVPALIVVWEAVWLRLTGGTVGHWLTGMGIVWPNGTPSYLRLCWRTVKRYLFFLLVGVQPSNVSPGALLVETVGPIAFGRVSAALDGDGIVASRGRSVATTCAVFAVCLAVPAMGIAVAWTPGRPTDDLRPPLLGASLVGIFGAVLSVISVADAWQSRGELAEAAPAPAPATRGRLRRSGSLQGR